MLKKELLAVGCMLSIALAANAAPENAWPELVVTIDQMKMLDRMDLHIPTPRAIDRSKTSTVVLHLLVEADGKPSQVRVEQSSGNPNIDETVLRAAWKTRFEPYRVDERPVPVTVVAPMHIPFVERKR